MANADTKIQYIYKTKKDVMEQERALLEKENNVAEVKSKAPDWILAGFKNEEEYNELLKKLMSI